MDLQKSYGTTTLSGLAIQVILNSKLNQYSQSKGDSLIVFVHNSKFWISQEVFIKPVEM